MNSINLFPHQVQALENTSEFNRVGYFLDMGLGKTFVGSEKATSFNIPIILVCPKSMIETWENHFKTFYTDWTILKSKDTEKLARATKTKTILIINYDLIWRREIFRSLNNFTLVLDESSYLKNPTSKRTKFISKMNPDNVVLLSGTPCGGKYEELWTQCRLLGWDISMGEFYRQFITTRKMDVGGFKIDMIVGYKNIDRLKRRLRQYGCVFMKTEEVFTLPDQLDHIVTVPQSKELKTFVKDEYVKFDNVEMMGDTILNKILYQRQLCSIYSKSKLDKLTDLLQSTNDRLIIFYNFQGEFDVISKLCKKLKKPLSWVNGSGKDLKNYGTKDDSVTLIQYQAGSMGLNLQKSNKIIYYSLTQSSEMYEQSRKRTNRIGQSRTCHYYHLLIDGSIELKILESLKKRKDFTAKLFEKI